jgi:hypothetical protein
VRTTADALRSVKRHVAAELGPQWEIRLASEDGTMHYPYGIVAAVGQAGPGASRRRGGALSAESALNVEVSQPFTVYCYPTPAATFEQGLLDGDAVADQLWTAFAAGVKPYRVPLYDYAGVPLDQPSDVRHEHDYLRLTDVQLNRVPDMDDEHRIIVVCDFRASWMRATARVDDLRAGRVLQSLRQTIVVEGAQQTVHPPGLGVRDVTFGRPRASKV